MSFRRTFNASLLFALEGPKRPSWITPILVMIAGTLLFFDAPAPYFGMALFAVLIVWSQVKELQLKHHRRVAAATSFDSCPQCGYDLTTIDGTRCPECGSDAIETIVAARKLVKHEDESISSFGVAIFFTIVTTCLLGLIIPVEAALFVAAILWVLFMAIRWHGRALDRGRSPTSATHTRPTSTARPGPSPPTARRGP